MLKKHIITIILLTLLSLYWCQISPISHKPILLDLNHNTNKNNLSLKFNIKEDGNNVTLFRGYSFILKLPSSLAIASNTTCSLKNSSDVSLGNFTSEYSSETGTMMCTYNDSSSNSLTGVSLSGDLTLTFNGISISTTTVDTISIGLYTSKSLNGILITRIPAFRGFALYADYKTMSSEAALTLGEVSISNSSGSLSCTETPCTKLYPYSDFSITFDVNVNKYIDTDQSLIWFKLNGITIPDKILISSEAIKNIDETDPQAVNVLESKLLSSSTDGSLSLTKISTGSFVISSINKYINSNSEVKILNLIPGRKFSITLSGFNTGSNVNVSALTSIEILGSYKNTVSYFSYYSKTITTSNIDALDFNSSVSGSETNISSSVYHSDGTEIYENGSYPLTFKIRIPGVNAGKLRITSVSTANTVFSLVASTCDFSDDSSFDNTFGNRPVCVPTYNGYTTSQLTRSFSSPSITSSNDTAIEINFSQISNFRDITFNIWGYANKCTDYNGTTFINSIFTSANLPFFALKFKYEFIVNDSVVAEKTVTSKIECYKNIRLEGDDYAKINNNSSTSMSAFDNNSSLDYLVYQEINNWNPLTTGVYTPVDGDTPHNFAITGNDYTLSSLSDIITTDTFFSLYSTINSVNKLALPYTPSINSDGNNPPTLTNSSDLVSGRIVINIPSYLTSNVSTTNTNCALVFHTDNSGDTIILNNGSDSTANNYFSLSNQVLTTNLINGGAATTKVLNYNDYTGTTFGMHTNCYAYKSYSTLTIKSIYQHVSFFLKYERNISGNDTSPTFKASRVNRFFKLFNGQTYGFRSGNTVSQSSNLITIYKPAIVNTSVDNLCILQVEQELFSSLKENSNSLVLTLINQRLIEVGDNNYDDKYPISSVKTEVNAYPLYSEDIYDVENNNSSYNYSSRTQVDIDRGYLFDSSDKDAINTYFGSSIVLTGISNSNINTNSETNTDPLYSLVPCHSTTDSVIIVQGFNISTGGTINNTDNVLLDFISSSPENPAGASFGEKLDLAFPNYRSASNDNDILNVSNYGDLVSFKTALLLVNDIEFNPSDGNNNEFFGNKYVQGQYSSIKINNKSYSNYFFSVGASNIALSASSNISFLTRPNMPTYYSDNSDLRIKIHGLGLYGASSSVFNYFTNNDSSAIVSTTNLPVLNNTNETDDLYFVISASQTVYAGDFGANLSISAFIYSDITSSGSLNMLSDSFTSNTLCVRSGNANNVCAYGNNSLQCNDIDLNKNDYVTITFSCYNVKIINSSVTIKKTSSFVESNNLLTVVALNDSSKNFGIDVALKNIDTIIPVISDVSYVQSTNNGGLANIFFQINLGRTYRFGQTVKLTAAIDSIYVDSVIPHCSFMLVSTLSNLETIKFYDNISNGTAFVDTCTIESVNNVSTITLLTKSYVSSTTPSLSKYVLIKLSPVYAAELSEVKYSINTYLGSNTTAVISSAPLTNTNRNAFPISDIDTSLYSITTDPTIGLCNLTDMFPRIPSAKGELLFTVTLSGTTDFLKSINTVGGVANATSKTINEISIYMDPTIYMRNENIWCYYKSAMTPCIWTSQGYINIKFTTDLIDGNHIITIQGITIPRISKGNNDNKFYCSVNYYSKDIRENLIVGTGTSDIYSYSASTKGNIIEFIPKNGLVMDNIPRSKEVFNFRFNLDTTLGLTSLSQTFTASENNNPVILIEFPKDYDFSISGEIITTMTSTSFIDNADYTSFSEPSSLNIASTQIRGNYIIVKFDYNSFTVESNIAYFDLSLSNVPTPNNEVNGSLISISIINDLDNASSYFTTYSNLNNVMGNQISNIFNDYYQGPFFSFSDSTIALITTESSVTIVPGRYFPITFTVSGENANAQTELSLSENDIFKTLDTSVSLNTGNNKSNTMRLGVPCNTLPGSYLVTFDTNNTEGSFYNLSPIRVVVLQAKNNEGKLYISNTKAYSNSLISNFNIPVGGYIKLFIHSEYAVVEDVVISLDSSSENNDSTFTLYSTVGSQNILAGKNRSTFSYTISTEAETSQITTLSSQSRCFGFGTSASSTKTITYAIDTEGLTDLSNLNISNMFVYDVTVQDKNRIDLIFTPLAKTNFHFALVCIDSEYPTYATVTSDAVDDLDSSLYNIQSFTYYDSETSTISFSNLKRGTSYKLKVWINNFSVNNDFLINYETNKAINSTNSTDNVSFVTANKAENQNILLNFGLAQTTNLLDRILLLVQNNFGSNINIFRATSKSEPVYSKGRKPSSVGSCSDTYFTDNFNDTQKIRTTEEEEEYNKTHSTDPSTSDFSTTDTANTDATTNTTRLLQDTTPTYAESIYLVFKQSDTSNELVDLNKEVTEFYNQTLSSINDLKKFVEYEDIKINGDIYESRIVIDKVLSSSDFSIEDFKYVNGELSFIPISNSNITCDWKLNNNVTDFTAEEISDCAEDNIYCGQVDFIQENTVKTNITIGTLGEGSYYINILCDSEIPQSPNQIIFKNPEPFVIGSVDSSTSVSICDENSSAEGCHSIFLIMKISLILIFITLIFDY